MIVVTLENGWARFLSESDREIASRIGSSTTGMGSRPALIVIDVMQAFFGEPQEAVEVASSKWPFSCGQNAWDALPHLQHLVQGFRDKGLPIFYATMEGPQFAPVLTEESGHSKASEQEIVQPGEIMLEVAPDPADMVFTKRAPSAFFGTSLMSYLNSLRVDSVVLCGTSTSGCVRATTVDAFSYNFQVAVAQDATFDRFDASHALSLFDMAVKYAHIAPTQKLVSELAELPDDLFADPTYDRNFEATTARASTSS